MKYINKISLFIWESLSWGLVLLLFIEVLHFGASSLFLPLGFLFGVWVVLTVILLYLSPKDAKLVLSGRLLGFVFLVVMILFVWRFVASSLQ